MKAILTIAIFMWSSSSLAYGLIHDVEKRNRDGFEVHWASCSAFPTINFKTQAISSTDIIVSFRADSSSSCVYPDALSEPRIAYYTLHELFQSAGIDLKESSKAYIEW